MITKHPDYLLVSTTFPMFGANIKRLWGSKDFAPYMKELTEAAQSGAKQGFPLDVLKALLRLEDLHGKLHPEVPAEKSGNGVQDNEDFQKFKAAYPAIGDQLAACWGSAEFAPYAADLLSSNKGDIGRAFPFDSLMALHAVIENHNKEFAGKFPAVGLWAA